jgi:hypothetical protein
MRVMTTSGHLVKLASDNHPFDCTNPSCYSLRTCCGRKLCSTVNIAPASTSALKLVSEQFIVPLDEVRCDYLMKPHVVDPAEPLENRIQAINIALHFKY